MIDEGSYRNPVDQLGHTARMVVVIVGQQHVVDLAYARTLGCGKNPVRVAAIVARPSCVNEQRFARRGYKKCGLAALNVDEVTPARSRVAAEADSPAKRMSKTTTHWRGCVRKKTVMCFPMDAL